MRNRKGPHNVLSGLFNLRLVALHRNLVVQNDTLHLCAHGSLSVFDRLCVHTVAYGTLIHYNAQQVCYANTGEEVELITTGQESTACVIEERVAWTVVGSLSSAWVVVFGVFLLLMKKKYRRTFFTTRPGKQWATDFFVKGAEVGSADGQQTAVGGDPRGR